MTIACPSCGFLTIAEETYGTYDIFEVCGWEDDQVQLANPCSGGGANSESLHESQVKALEKWPLEVKEFKGIRRSANWRPLNEAEIQQYEIQAKEKHWANKGVIYEPEVYWVRNS